MIGMDKKTILLIALAVVVALRLVLFLFRR
jgi:hypothetical protein